MKLEFRSRINLEIRYNNVDVKIAPKVNALYNRSNLKSLSNGLNHSLFMIV